MGWTTCHLHPVTVALSPAFPCCMTASRGSLGSQPCKAWLAPQFHCLVRFCSASQFLPCCFSPFAPLADLQNIVLGDADGVAAVPVAAAAASVSPQLTVTGRGRVYKSTLAKQATEAILGGAKLSVERLKRVQAGRRGKDKQHAAAAALCTLAPSDDIAVLSKGKDGIVSVLLARVIRMQRKSNSNRRTEYFKPIDFDNPPSGMQFLVRYYIELTPALREFSYGRNDWTPICFSQIVSVVHLSSAPAPAPAAAPAAAPPDDEEEKDPAPAVPQPLVFRLGLEVAQQLLSMQAAANKKKKKQTSALLVELQRAQAEHLDGDAVRVAPSAASGSRKSGRARAPVVQVSL
jgi:hypothetical protein